MSTIKAANLAHPSSPTTNLVLKSDGNVSGAGLDLIVTQSFSAVSTVSVNNCFTSTYDNYRIICSLQSSVADVAINMRMRVSAADNSTANYYRQRATVQNTTFTGTSDSAGTTWELSYAGTSLNNLLAVDVIAPQLAQHTSLSALNNYAGRYIEIRANSFQAATQFDGFTLYPGSGTISGVIRIYGYRNA
jgi:hypothetical protein